MPAVAVKKVSAGARRRTGKAARREAVEIPAGGLFAGREHLFGALSFKPVKGSAAKRLI